MKRMRDDVYYFFRSYINYLKYILFYFIVELKSFTVFNFNTCMKIN